MKYWLKIDLDNTDFYASSSKGKNRLVNMLRHKILGVSFEDMNLKVDAIEELNKEIKRVENN